MSRVAAFSLLALVAAEAALAAPAGERYAMMTNKGVVIKDKRQSNAKKGIAFNNVTFANAIGSAASWAYDWAHDDPSGLASGVEYVPMLWNNDSNHLPGWPPAAASAYLGFNEPDNSGQADMTVGEAVAAWQEYMEPLAGSGVTLVSPAVTNGAAPAGQAWLDEFLSECSGCSVGAVALHIYDEASNTAYFQSYLGDAAEKYYGNQSLPVWVTEFGITGGDPVAFLDTMIPWLDSTDGIDRYAYFMAGDGEYELNNSDGSLNAAGEAYVSEN